MWRRARAAGSATDYASAGEGVYEGGTADFGEGCATEEGAATSGEEEGSAANVAAGCESSPSTAEAAASEVGRCVYGKPC